MKTYDGGCHCGAVRFRVEVDEPLPAALDCNCSICTKKGFLHLLVSRERILVSKGEGNLTTYTFNTGVAKHMFCKTCGMHPFYTPRSHPNGVDVNVRCLDGDAIDDFTVAPFDGKEWERNVASITGEKA